MAKTQSSGWRQSPLAGAHYETLAYRRPGSRAGAPVILALHGFTGGGRDFEICAAHDAGAWHWICPDLPGHGACRPRSPDAGVSLERWLSDFAGWVPDLVPRGSILLGYSMGGRLALHAALRLPDRFATVITVGAHPGLCDPGARAERRAIDARRAASLHEEGLDAFLERWRAEPLIATQERIPEPWQTRLREVRQSQNPQALADALIAFSPARIPVEHARLATFPIPFHALVGSQDARYMELAEWLHSKGFCTVVHAIPNAGHAAHLENPQGFSAVLNTMIPRNSQRIRETPNERPLELENRPNPARLQ